MRVSDSSPGVTKTFRIHARHSDLARLQAYRVGDALKKEAGVDIEFGFRASLGDLNQNDPLWKMPEKGVFTEDFLQDLIEGSAEMVVHSWKDLPTEARPSTEIVATMPRADVRDLLLFRCDRFAPARALRTIRVLTSSPRRSHNLHDFLKTHLPFGELERVSFESVRGNIPTRLKKLMSQDVDGLIVAKAAIDRLLAAPEAEFADVQMLIRDVLTRTRFMVLPLTVNPTAAAQGALAVEIKRGRDDVQAALAKIHCPSTFECVQKERRILAGYGGGCHQKIGVNVLSRPYGEITFLRGLTDQGEVLDRVELKAKHSHASPVSASNIFPRADEDSAFFTREPMKRADWDWAEKESLLWVARESAWPRDFQSSPNAIVWTAGLQSWRKLAARGVWVNGSAEGLGEDEPTRLEALLGRETLPWLKLTHAQSETSTGARICATYRLVKKTETPDLSGRTHFYWLSGTAFDRALELFPNIRSAQHASGPGHTLRHLRNRLGDSAKIDVYLSVETWRKAMLERS